MSRDNEPTTRSPALAFKSVLDEIGWTSKEDTKNGGNVVIAVLAAGAMIASAIDDLTGVTRRLCEEVDDLRSTIRHKG